MNHPIPPDPLHPRNARRAPPDRQGAGRLVKWVRHALEKGGASTATLGIVAFVGILGYAQLLSNVPLVVALLGVVLYEFQKRIDQGLPLMQIAAMVGVLQWTIGPLLAYNTSLVEGRYAMYVNEASYFGYALPGTAAYVFGLLTVGSSVRQREILRNVRRDQFMMLGLALNSIAIVARFSAERVPGGLAFLVHLLSQLSYVGTLYFLFSRNPYRWLWIAFSLFPLLKSSAESAMFHDVILWLGLLFCYWYGMRPRDSLHKVAFLAACGVILFTIQAIKQEYRAKLWNREEASLIWVAVDFWTRSGATTNDSMLANVVTRLNQGWIISAVLSHVPKGEPFAVGETIKNAVIGGFLPRAIMVRKAKAGGQVNFRRFTGLDLSDSTSMAVSPLGEAYANFGREGGILLMLGFGLAFSSFYAFCLRRSVIHPTFLFWIPLIFYQAIKAETEFSTVLNQVTKGSVVAFGLHWLIDLTWLSAHLPKRDAGRRRGHQRKGIGRASTAPEGSQAGTSELVTTDVPALRID